MTDNPQTDSPTPVLPAIRMPARIAVAAIRLYQITLSPWLGNQCRFYPTCSHYGIEALSTHGLIKGLWLTAKRLGRCQPFHAGGIDEVPHAQDPPTRPGSAN
ncbi:MAG: membrane protein insertion efficiency factor YidD [bacterium]